ncbi:hypothetical protein [Streptomyces adelaidensis]|uniref:hypothetical protein n=1 Tax=Streptomyces adelaidensis TaxID=2796465 RepID=UPI001908839A|nr:hypothetical protein [Streptomyces adelaidensis]
MVVDEAVATALREQSQAQVGVFVAGCAERMAQVFIGLRSDDPERGGDVDTVVLLLEELWSAEAPQQQFQEYVDSLSGFPELDEASDEEIIDAGEIYSFYAVLGMRYAALYRSSGDAETALKCAHSCLTAMGQLDQNIPVATFFAQEAECQQRVISSYPLGEVDEIAQLRNADQVISRERLEALKERLPH